MTSTSSSSGKKRKPAATSTVARDSGSSRRRGSRSAGALALHDFSVALRALVPILVAAIVAFIVMMPVSTAAVPDTSIFNLDYVHDQMKWRFWADDLLYGVYFGVVLFGLVLGVRSFKFLLVKCETTAFLSLPLSRATLFATRMGACVVALVLGIGIPLAISLGVNIVALDVWDGLFADFAYVYVGLVVVGLLSCAVAVLSCTVSGTVSEAIAFAVALLALVSVGSWSLNALMNHLLVGNAYGEYLYNGTTVIAPTLLEATERFNPLLFFLGPAAEHAVFIARYPVYFPEPGNWALVAAWFAVAVVVSALALFALTRRKGEQAGVAGQFLPGTFVVGLVIGLAAFGATFTLMAQVNHVAAIVGAITVFLLISFVLFRGPLKGVTRMRTTLAVMGCEAVCLAAVVACVATGGLGFSSFVPAVDDVESVSVSRTSAPDFLATRFDSASASGGGYYYAATYTYAQPDEVAIVCDAHRAIAQTGHAKLGTDRFDFGSTVFLYDVKIDYAMKDGSHVVRYYDRATADELYALTALDATETSRALDAACITGDVTEIDEASASELAYSSARKAFADGDVYLCDAYYASPVKLNCTAEARAGLLAALAADAAGQGVEDRYHPAGTARGILMFTQVGEADASTFAYSLSNSVIYLTDEYEHTLEWLAENDLASYVEGSGAKVLESLTFQRFDPYGGMNAVTSPTSMVFKGYRTTNASHFVATQDFGTRFELTDADSIDEIAGLLRNTYFLDESGYLVCAKLGGIEEYAYFYLPDSSVPDWLLRQAG